MADEALHIPFLQNGIWDTNGDPLVGGKVYTYDSGTTNARTTWQDNDKATPHANPIVLDGNGMAEAYGDGIYRFIIKTSADVTLYDIDGPQYNLGMSSGAQTFTGVKTFSGGIKVDTISEETAGNGVAIDGVTCKDNDVYVDAVEEKTAAGGVLIETSAGAGTAVKVKDGVLLTDNITERSTDTGTTIEGILLKDSQVKTDTIIEKTGAAGVTIDGLQIKDTFPIGMLPVVASVDLSDSINVGGYWSPIPIGVYQMGTVADTEKFHLEFTTDGGSTWYQTGRPNTSEGPGLLFSDGTNMRISHPAGSGAAPIYYQKF